MPALSVNAEAVDDSAFTIGTDYVTTTGFLADETAPDSVDEGDVGIARMTLDRKLLTRIVGATDANRLDIDASGHAQIDIAADSSGGVEVVQDTAGDLNMTEVNSGDIKTAVEIIDDWDNGADQCNIDIAAVSVTALPVSKDSNANSETNPLYVYNVKTVVSGYEVHDYDLASAIASDASSNHDYTVANTTFFLKSVIVSGSGNIKAEIQTGPVASLATKAVVFLQGRQGDTKQVTFDPPIEVPVTSTGTVRVIKTNRQGTATDLYSTIIGSDV
jgi:hypothetical protein